MQVQPAIYNEYRKDSIYIEGLFKSSENIEKENSYLIPYSEVFSIINSRVKTM